MRHTQSSVPSTQNCVNAAYGVNPFFASSERPCEIMRVKAPPSEPLIGQADEGQPGIESGIG